MVVLTAAALASLSSADGPVTVTNGLHFKWSDFADRIDLEDVRERSGLSPYRPNHLLANDSLLRAIWSAGRGDEVAFLYLSGVEVTIVPIDTTPVPNYRDRAGYFRSRAEGFVNEPGWGLTMEEILTTVDGRPALAVPWRLPDQNNKGFVEFVTADGSTLVSIRGYVDIPVLITIAESVE